VSLHDTKSEYATGNSIVDVEVSSADAVVSSLWTLGDDSAISAPGQDEFGRAAFARHLAQVIDSSPRSSTFRIGLYGEWGEGKTSVMGMMAHELSSIGHVCARISTWATEEPADILRQVADALSVAVGVGAPVRMVKQLVGHADSLKELRKLAAEGPWWLQGADLLFGRAAGRVLDDKSHELTSDLLKKAMVALGDRRAVLMVDDLDRTKPEALPQILMALRESVNIPGVYFVLGLSTGAVADGLRKSGFGLEDPERFLEKIIEYPAYLPAISGEALETYARQRIGKIEGLRRPDVLQELAPLLPQNPRRLKLFLRTVAALRRTLERFDDDEVNWTEFYLAQLLLAEFPIEARHLREDRVAIRAMDSAWMNTSLWKAISANNDREETLPEVQYAPTEPPARRERYLELCRQLRQQQSMSSSYTVSALLALDAAPPLKTRREARDFLAQLESQDRSNWGPTVERTLSDAGVDGRAVAQALWTFLLGQQGDRRRLAFRSLRLGELADADAGVARLSAIIDCWVQEVGAFRHGYLSANAWLEWLDAVAMWCSADATRSGTNQSALALAALEKALDETPEIMIELIHQALSQKQHLGHHGVYPDNYKSWIDKVERRLATEISEAVYQRFLRPDGLDLYFYCDWFRHGKCVLFSEGSPFYDGPGLGRLGALADLAANGSQVVIDNFLTLLRLLESALEGRLNIPGTSVKDLLSKPGVAGTIWRSVTRVELTDAGAGMLRAFRGRALAVAGVAAHDLPVPSWWPAPLKAAAVEDEEAAAKYRLRLGHEEPSKDPSAPSVSAEGSSAGGTALSPDSE
jgi:hypothetical protein